MTDRTRPLAGEQPSPVTVSPLLITALLLTASIAAWGVVDNESLASTASAIVTQQFQSRAWFIMLTVSVMLIISLGLAVSKYGDIVLGQDDDKPEFSTISWLTMLFAAGMGVGLLYWGTAEPLTHFILLKENATPIEEASAALFITYFHWGLHAWAIYALTGLVIAYFSFRLGCPALVSAPIVKIYGSTTTTRSIGWLCDLLAIVAIAIGLGGSVAMGVFQIEQGILALLGQDSLGQWLRYLVFAALCFAFIPPLLVDLSNGMALLSNIAMAVAAALLIFILLTGPTAFLMGSVVQGFGEYAGSAFVHGFKTFTFLDEKAEGWFRSWTLTYMVWWLAWAPFVGVFIARISRGRTVREFIAGVILAPTGFSILWFGVFGGVGFFTALRTDLPILDVVQNNVSQVTFFVLEQFPAPWLTIAAVVIAAFLFLVTSVVSAAFVLGMLSTNGDINPSPQVKLAWGVVLGALGLVMILSDSIDAVKSIIALGALPFVFVTLVLVVCLLRALGAERASTP